MKESFIVRNEIEQQTATLTDAQMGQLFRAMLQFNRDIEPVLPDPLVSLAFSFVRDSMERDRRKYEATCEKRKIAGAKGGRPKKQKVSSEPAFFNPESKRFSENPDSVPEPDPEPVPESVPVSVIDSQDGQTVERDRCEKDFVDVLNYAQNAGYSFTSKQKRQLKQWCVFFPFEVVIMDFDRSTFYNGKSVTYVYRILQEWKDKGLKDVDAVTDYVEAREGGGEV
ncbi:MAG: DnaD domain protein [Clostridiales bacterium]|nr:DnaD domain protein [Clostridiales bacterium]